MAVMSYTVQQVSRYTPVADELKTMLKIIQNDWGCKVISVCETTVNKTPNCSSQAFIIIYDNPQKDLQPAKCGHWDYSEKENGECEWYFCSECDSPAEQLYTDDPLLSEFCPHCGADMRGEQSEDT